MTASERQDATTVGAGEHAMTGPERQDTVTGAAGSTR